MKHGVILSLFVLFSTLSLAQNDTVFVKYVDVRSDDQNYHIDTLFQENMSRESYLIGTTLLPDTRNSISCYNAGIWPTSVEMTPCNSHNEDRFGSNKVTDIQTTDSTLTITTKIIGNCCHEFLCDPEVDDNGILQLNYFGYGTYCSCNCCFGLTFKFRLDKFEGMSKVVGVEINQEEATFRALNLPTGQ